MEGEGRREYGGGKGRSKGWMRGGGRKGEGERGGWRRYGGGDKGRGVGRVRKGGGRWRRGRRGSGAESKAESRRQSRERAREQVCSYGWRIQSVRTWWRNDCLLGLKVGILVAKPFTRCGEQANLLRTRERGVFALGKVWIFSFWFEIVSGAFMFALMREWVSCSFQYRRRVFVF